MPYLNLDLNFHDHPKTRRLVCLLGETADVYPIRLWAYCAKIHPKDGALRGYSAKEVEAIIRWIGTPGEAVAALLKVSFINRIKNGYSCADWSQHQGHLEAFSRRAKRAAKARWSKYAPSIAKEKSSNAPTVPYRTVPTIPNHTNRTEQKESVDLGEQFKTAVKDLADKKARAAKEERLLGLKWNVSGDHNGKRVQDLPGEYCEWALEKLTSIGQEYKDALAVRLEQKTSEAIK